MIDLPTVGSRIRVTRTPPAEVFEGVVASHDSALGCVLLTDGQHVAVEGGDAWTITVEVLEEAPPAPPEQPPYGSFVGNDGSTPRELFLRQDIKAAPELGPDEYYDLFAHTRVDWPAVLRAVPEPVRWVPAPHLAELEAKVAALAAELDLMARQHASLIALCRTAEATGRLIHHGQIYDLLITDPADLGGASAEAHPTHHTGAHA